MTNIMHLIGGGLAFLAVSWIADKFVFKQEFNAQRALINAVTVIVILGVSGIIAKKTVGGKGLAEIPSKIASK